MKILAYNLIDLSKITFDQQYSDYMCDLIFIGLKQLLSKDLETNIQLPHHYKDYQNKDSLYGRGFSYGCLLDKDDPPLDIDIKIKDKYFNQIIILQHNNLFMNSTNVDIVKDLSQYSLVKYVEGNDSSQIQKELLPYCLFYKRELREDIDKVKPISFCIPEEKIIHQPTEKTKDLSDNLPLEGGRSTWRHETEESYYSEYQRAWFGHTRPKAGWDCMRHYEILSQGCIPIFEGLEQCPKQTLTFFPKEVCQEILNIRPWENPMSTLHKMSVIYELLRHTRKFLTTRAMAQYLLES